MTATPDPAGTGGSADAVVAATAGSLLDKGAWEQACDMLGLNPWAVNEGLLDRDERLTFTIEQARELGLLDGSSSKGGEPGA
jgi:hypothetical protein